MFDGLHATAFLGASAKAADANLLDGLDSTAFARSANVKRALWLGAGLVQYSPGVTATKQSTGVVRVDLGDANNLCTPTVTVEETPAMTALHYVSSGDGYDVKTFALDGTTAVDRNFDFVAVCAASFSGGTVESR
jgi:hypothetical protein